MIADSERWKIGESAAGLIIFNQESMGRVQGPHEPLILCEILVIFTYVHFGSKRVCGFCQVFKWVFGPKMLKD